MPLATLGLLGCAALIHSGAHILLKRACNKLAFVWWQLLAALVFYSPILLTSQWGWSLKVWLIILASGLAEAAFFYATARSYTLGDLAIAYPLARGSAPLFTALWAALLLHERPSPLGTAGIVIVAMGLFLVNLPSWADIVRPLQGLVEAAPRWALTAGLFISTYSIIDKVGVKYVPPLLYIYIVLVVTWLVMAAGWLANWKCHSHLISEEWRANKWQTMGAGVAVVGAYALVLAAMQQSPVSYVGSIREVSVVLTAWVSTTFLGEDRAGLRVPASVLVAAGILLIAMGG